MIKTLMEYNANPNLKGPIGGLSPLELAQRVAKQDIVAYLRSISNKN